MGVHVIAISISSRMISLLLLSLAAQAAFSSEILDALDIEERGCYDVVSDCRKHYSYCQNDGWLSYMQTNCKKTCGYCGGGSGGGSSGGGSSGGSSRSGTLGGSPIGSGDCGMANGRSMSDTSSYIVGGKDSCQGDSGGP